MKIIADTNLLVRALTEDDARQGRIAQAQLRNAEIVAIGTSSLCELVWVLLRLYRATAREAADAIRSLIHSANVAADRATAEAGLAMLDAGGDFADGVIAFEGRKLGGETFVSFDRQAVKLLAAQGYPARLPS